MPSRLELRYLFQLLLAEADTAHLEFVLSGDV